jgi:WD40 repeat protein
MDQLPTSFGKQSRGTDIEAQINRTKRATTPSSHGRDSAGSSDSDSEKDDDDDDEYPISHALTLPTQNRPVISISLDSAGSRLITATLDTIKLHDFASMTPTTLRAFKSIESTAIHHVEFGISSSFLEIATTARILSRDGEPLTEFVKGDMYIRDMHNTKGHISEITTGTWHPIDKQICVTAGTDSTIRIWDVNNKRCQRDVIVQKSKAAGGRTRMTAVAWGSLLVGAAFDGALAFWGTDGPYTRPSAEVKEAHAKDTWTGGLDISGDGRLIVSRGGDNMIKCKSFQLHLPNIVLFIYCLNCLSFR